MRPEWRLATNTLSTRRSRTALLVATVALSAALIAAVSTAMNSIQQSARKQLQQLAGTGDARLAPSGLGADLDPALVTLARRWDEVLSLRAETKAAVRVVTSLQGLEPAPEGDAFVRASRRAARNVVATGYTSLDEGLFTLADGRLPSAPGEIVIDGTLAAVFTWEGSRAQTPLDLPSRQNGRREPLRGPHPQVPEHADADQARRINDLVGVRVGDELQVARGALPDVNISAIVQNREKAMEMARAAGITPSLSDLAALMRAPTTLRVVGISYPPPFGGRPRIFMTADTLSMVTGKGDRPTEISLSLRPDVDADAFVARRQPELPSGVLLKPTARATSGLDRNIQASRLGFLLATTMAFLCAGFIITTAMTTGVVERQRELGILRAIGAVKGQLARGQLAIGLVIGLLGAAVGIPLGVALAAALVEYLKSQIDVTLSLPWWGVGMAAGGSLLAGLIGAAWPAWRATRVSPLEALASRAAAPRARGVVRLLIAGLLVASLPVAITTWVEDGQWRFWLYVFLGLPGLFFGFFALAVPVMHAVGRLLSGPVSAALGLPPRVVWRSLAATPYRFGFTAGSMMMGMALMVAIWTQGRAIQRDWLGKFEFPDAFVTGFNITRESQDLVRSLPYVTDTVAITIHPVETGSFGVTSLQKYRSTFIAFEPDAFFRMVKPVWIQGDQASAREKLARGGAVIVAREFTVAQGLGLGDTITLRSQGVEHAFTIVGVVTSPGLEVVSQFFNIGEDYSEQSLHAVFGTRDDLRDKFGSDAIHLLQISLAPGVDDVACVRDLRERLAGAGILDAGSGRRIKENIEQFVGTGLFAVSCVAVVSMLIAGFGVANLIVAGIHARRFEFGVLQAVGASRGLVVRLVLAEAVLIGLAAAALGTAMGLVGVYAGQRIDEKLFGLVLQLRPPVLPIAAGWGITLIMTVGAAAPALAALWRRRRS
jgi:putative ABC transport system permease protein